MSVNPAFPPPTHGRKALKTPSRKTRSSNTSASSTPRMNRPAANLMGSALQKDPDIVGVFAANLFSAEGTATGVRQAGKQEQVKIVGFDAGPNQVKALKEGTVQALVAQQPALIGQYGVDAAVTALEGGLRRPRSKPASRSSPGTMSTARQLPPSTSPAADLDRWRRADCRRPDTQDCGTPKSG